MTISGVSSNLVPLIQSALDINKQLDNLQTQLGSGQKSTTYAGLGSQSGIAVALGAQLSTINSFDDTIANVGTTVSLQQTVLQQIASIGNTVRSSATAVGFCHRRHRPDHVAENGRQHARSNAQSAEYSRQ